jgi:hypothetical protein
MTFNKPLGVILVLVWCLFMGVTAISIGFGAAFPPLNRIAGPFVCPNGAMRVDSQTYRPSPGTTITTLDWQCVDNRTGEAQRINEMSMFLINGLIYGTLLFAVVMLWWWVATKRRARRVQQQAAVDVPTAPYTPAVEVPPAPHFQFESLESIELQELKRLYDEGQLSDVEYWRKLNKIIEHTAGQPSAQTSAADPIVEELRKLKRMLNEGLITEEDYEQKKAAILSRM